MERDIWYLSESYQVVWNLDVKAVTSTEREETLQPLLLLGLSLSLLQTLKLIFVVVSLNNVASKLVIIDSITSWNAWLPRRRTLQQNCLAFEWL